jgi:hypothetical protein
MLVLTEAAAEVVKAIASTPQAPEGSGLRITSPPGAADPGTLQVTAAPGPDENARLPRAAGRRLPRGQGARRRGRQRGQGPLLPRHAGYRPGLVLPRPSSHVRQATREFAGGWLACYVAFMAKSTSTATCSAVTPGTRSRSPTRCTTSPDQLSLPGTCQPRPADRYRIPVTMDLKRQSAALVPRLPALVQPVGEDRRPD